MFVIEVIPLTRGSHVGSLTYYSSTPFNYGSLLTVPIRSRETRAMVVGCEPLSAAKAALRAASFSLRRLPTPEKVEVLPPIIVEVAMRLSKQLPATAGAILYSLLPPEVREGTEVLESSLPCHGDYYPPDVSVMSALSEDRLDTYRRLIREAFAHRGSVLLLVPTAAYVERTAIALSQGIAERVIVFSSALSPKKLSKAYAALQDLSVAKLIIATPSHAFVDRHDITNIIVDQARSQHYRSRSRPYLDVRTALVLSAKAAKRQLLFGDVLVRTEDEWLRRSDIYQTEGEYQRRIAFGNKLKIIKQKDKSATKEAFQLFSPELSTAIEKTLKAKGSVFLYAARRGLSPVVVCVDCGHIFRCPDSGAPYSLFRTVKEGEEKRWFLSPVSGRKVRAPDNCSECGSWRLKERGIGIQQIYDELKAHYSEDRIVLFDHSTATTARKAAQLMSTFYDQKGMILLGTSMVLPYLEKPVSISAIMSLEAARSIPTWRVDEELMSLLFTLRENTTDTLYVQTRFEPDSLLEYALQGQVEKFYDEELSLREALNYPPFSVFIHLTISGSALAVAPLEAEIVSRLKAWSISFYSAPSSTEHKSTRYGLIRVPRKDWPDTNLLKELLSLPPVVRIEIDPARIV